MDRRAVGLLAITLALGSADLTALAYGAPESEPLRSSGRGVSLAALIPRFSAGESKPVTIDRDLRSVKVTLSGFDAEGEELRGVAASLLSLKWERGQASEDHSWRLTADAYRRKLPESLRRQAITRGRTRLQERVIALRAAVRGVEGAARDLERRFPQDAALLTTAGAGRLRFLTAMTDDQLRTLVAQSVWLSPRIGTESSALEDSVRAAFPLRQMRITTRDAAGQVTSEKIVTPYDVDGNHLYLVLQPWGLPDLPALRGRVVNLDPPRGPAGPVGTHLPLARGDRRPADVLLPPEAPLTGADGPYEHPWLKRSFTLARADEASVRIGFQEVISRISASTGLRVISDWFSSTRVRSIARDELTSDLPLGEILDRVSRAFQCRWRIEGDWLMFRHSRWFFEEQAEVPDSVIDRVEERVARAGGLTLAELASLTGSLRREQFQTLANYHPELIPIVQAHTALSLLASFTPVQRLAAEGDVGLGWDQLTPAQQALVMEVLRSERPYGLLSEPQERQQWRVLFRWQGDLAATLVVGYRWDARDFTTMVLPPFTEIDPRITSSPDLPLKAEKLRVF